MGGPASPLPVIGFSFPRPHTKGPLRRWGRCSRQLQLPLLFTAPQKPLEPRVGTGERSRQPPRQGKETASAGSNGGTPGAAPHPTWGQPWGPPGAFPRLQPQLFRSRPAAVPVAMPHGLPGAACPRPRSCPATAARSSGRTQSFHFAGLAEPWPLPPATGQQDSPQLRCPPVPCPQQPQGHPCSATSPAHMPGAAPASLRLHATKLWGMQDQHRFSQTLPWTHIAVGRAWG